MVPLVDGLILNFFPNGCYIINSCFRPPPNLVGFTGRKKFLWESKWWVQKGKAGWPGQAGSRRRDCAHEPTCPLRVVGGEERSQGASLPVSASGEGEFAVVLLAGAGVSPAVLTLKRPL